MFTLVAVASIRAEFSVFLNGLVLLGSLIMAAGAIYFHWRDDFERRNWAVFGLLALLVVWLLFRAVLFDAAPG